MKNLVVVALCLLLASCVRANSHLINSVSLGMTKGEVLQAMGPPVSTSAASGVEYLNYNLAENIHQAEWGRGTPYFVRIVNGRVDAYGRLGDFDSTKAPESTINLKVGQ